MNLPMDGNYGWGAALLPVAAGLLLEELTFGGLVRLFLAPWPKTGEDGEHETECNQPKAANRPEGEGK
jgi:hypothetical protein